MQSNLRVTAVIFLLFPFVCPQTSAPQTGSGPRLAGISSGVVVGKIQKNSQAEESGLQKGDVILAWSRVGQKGKVESPFDLLGIEMEQAPLGAIRLEGLRGKEKEVWSLGSAAWGLTTIPNFTFELLISYREAQELAQSGKSEAVVKAARRFKELADQYPVSRARWIPAWLFFHVAELLKDGQQWKEADDFYQSAIQSAPADGQAAEGQILRAWAKAYQQRSDWINAEKYFQRSTEKMESWGGGGLTIAANLNAIGRIGWQQGQLDKAEHYLGRALDIELKLAADGVGAATSLNDLGNVAWYRGDLAKAEQYYRRALDIREKLASGSLDVANSFTNLGLVAWQRGDLAKAEDYHRQALEIRQRLAPESSDAAAVFNNMGVVAVDRGDLAKAEEYYHQALRIREKLAPGSLDIASSFNNLGDVLRQRGDLAKAENYYRQALVIRERLAPGSLDIATSFNNLGDVTRQRGDLAKAESYYHQALEIKQKLAPESLSSAVTFEGLAEVAKEKKDLASSEGYYRQALIIRAKLAPESQQHAESLASLAGVMRQKGELDLASKLYEQALHAIENQTARLGGSEDVRASFRADHAGFYRDYIDLLIKLGQPELAFQVAERSRAQTLLEMLAIARLDIRGSVDPALLDQQRELQTKITAKSNRRVHLLENKQPQQQILAVEQEIADLLAKDQDIEGQIQANSPAYAALTQPQPLTLKEIQQLLDPETVLLEYVLGKERSYLWTVDQNSIKAFALPSRNEIEQEARQLYQLLSTHDTRTLQSESQREAKLNDAALTLSRIVLGPAMSGLRGKRLLIVSEGALQYIPFGILPDPSNEAAEIDQPVPLLARYEIVNLPSATILAELRRQEQHRQQPPKMVAVLADPVFDVGDERVRTGVAHPLEHPSSLSPTNSISERLTRSVGDVRGSAGTRVYLPRLPFTRREAQAILQVTPPGLALEALDFEASRMKAVSRQLAQYRFVHIATHGLLDSEHPELSGLVLSLVDRQGKSQDGFLGLEDIYNLDLPVDLVVLSACETGLGKEISGEGLIGLTRGFMYAGASRVIATTWTADDAATADLMAGFYKALEREGLSPAAALRQAQLQMWKQKRWHDPYYWAGFQIQGEWK
jgi:CHAT domain-containing protein/Tfp pilus assembly protein PilF